MNKIIITIKELKKNFLLKHNKIINP